MTYLEVSHRIAEIDQNTVHPSAGTGTRPVEAITNLQPMARGVESENADL